MVQIVRNEIFPITGADWFYGETIAEGGYDWVHPILDLGDFRFMCQERGHIHRADVHLMGWDGDGRFEIPSFIRECKEMGLRPSFFTELARLGLVNPALQEYQAIAAFDRLRVKGSGEWMLPCLDGIPGYRILDLRHYYPSDLVDCVFAFTPYL